MTPGMLTSSRPAAYNLRNSVEGDLKDKLEPADKETLEKSINETIAWLDSSAEASTCVLLLAFRICTS